MISTPVRRYGAIILTLLTVAFSAETLAKTHKETTHHHPHMTRSNAGSQQEYSRNSAQRGSLPDLRQYPSGTARKKAFLRAVMPYITSQNAAILAERRWLLSGQQPPHWSPSGRARLKDIARRYRVSWSGNMRHIPWDTLLERVDIIPASMVATMAAAESGWGTSRVARINNNLFGMKCSKKGCNPRPGNVKGYAHFDSLEASVLAYAVNLNTHPAYASFRQSRAQLRRTEQQVTADAMIHQLKGYSTEGLSYNNYLFALYQNNQQLIAGHL